MRNFNVHMILQMNTKQTLTLFSFAIAKNKYNFFNEFTFWFKKEFHVGYFLNYKEFSVWTWLNFFKKNYWNTACKVFVASVDMHWTVFWRKIHYKNSAMNFFLFGFLVFFFNSVEKCAWIGDKNLAKNGMKRSYNSPPFKRIIELF